MSVATAMARFRAKQAEQFTSAATVSRPVGEPDTDPDTGEVVQDYAEVYDGPCKIRPARTRSSDQVEAGETAVGKPDFEGKFPVNADIRRDDIVTCTGSTYDTGLVGQQFVVKKTDWDEWQIARVVTLEQVLVPQLNLESA